jgi:RNA polymerase sigma factor (sigma-70 family)
MDDAELHLLVRRAQSGDAAALEEVVRAVQDDVFDLAIRMLGDATYARDASQEVLVRVVTKLGTFRGDSGFRTWVYRVAANALLNFSGEQPRREAPFEEAEENIRSATAGEGEVAARGMDLTLVNEVKLVCAHGLLLCLDRPHRLAYVLGEVLELTSEEGAAVLEISPVAFRKRLSRARTEMEAFEAPATPRQLGGRRRERGGIVGSRRHRSPSTFSSSAARPSPKQACSCVQDRTG